MAKKKSDDYFAFTSGIGGKAKGGKPPAKKAEPAKKEPAKKPAAKQPPAKKDAKPAKAAFDPRPVTKMLTEKRFRARLGKDNRIDAVVQIKLADLLSDVEHLLNDVVDDLLVPEKSIAGLSNIQYKVFGANTKKNAVLLRVNADGSEVLDSLNQRETPPPVPPADDAESDDSDDTPIEPKVESNGEQPSLFDDKTVVGSPLEGNGEKLRPDANGRFVPAKVKSTDGEVERGFDALPFFRDADEQDVLAVAGHHWGEEESAQRVADFCVEQNPQIQEVYDYVEGLGPDEEYTVTVDGERAMAWLRQHRTALAFRIKQEFPGVVGADS